MIWRFIQRTWFRHLFTLRLFWDVSSIAPEAWFDGALGARLHTLWDKGLHANEPIHLTLWVGCTRLDVGIVDSN